MTLGLEPRPTAITTDKFRDRYRFSSALSVQAPHILTIESARVAETLMTAVRKGFPNIYEALATAIDSLHMARRYPLLANETICLLQISESLLLIPTSSLNGSRDLLK